MKNLKKLFVVIMCIAVALCCAFGIVACNDTTAENEGTTSNENNGEGTSSESDGGEDSGESNDFSYIVSMPDGAPALSLAQLMVENMQFDGKITYNVVNSNSIAAQVSSQNADICILPVNAAVQLAGSGDTYSLIGTVTHGNLYMLSAKYTQTTITAENLDTLVGKTVGCIQLTSFVGYVFQMILNDNNIAYTIVEDVSQAVSDKVNLIAISDAATQITPSAQFDYMIGAEPVVTAKTANSSLEIVGDIQAMYGEEGFPQAVMIAKNTVIEDTPEFLSEFIAAVKASADWIVSSKADMEDIVDAINSNYNGATSSLTAGNLTTDTIKRCAIKFVAASECREEIKSFIAKYEELTGTTLTLSDSFFYSAE